MKFIAAILMVFSVNAFADNHVEEIKDEAMIVPPEDKLASVCEYLEQHILDTHNRIVEIGGRNKAAVDVAVRPSKQMAQASAAEWAHQAQDSGIYGDLNCFERSMSKFRIEKASKMMKMRRDKKDKGWFD